jgi:hypothetical protein
MSTQGFEWREWGMPQARCSAGANGAGPKRAVFL